MDQLTPAEQREAVVKAVKDYAYYFDMENNGLWIKDEKLDEWLQDLRKDK